MEILYKDEYVQMTYDQENNMLIDVWTTQSENLSEEGFKGLLINWLGVMKKHQIKNALTDSLNFRVTLSPDLQNWIMENIAKEAHKFGYQKQALIMPDEFFANLSIELFADEQNSLITTQYFSDMTSARKWLLN